MQGGSWSRKISTLVEFSVKLFFGRDRAGGFSYLCIEPKQNLNHEHLLSQNAQ